MNFLNVAWYPGPAGRVVSEATATVVGDRARARGLLHDHQHLSLDPVRSVADVDICQELGHRWWITRAVRA